jgi:DNA-binding beta-propeller fold protein YncE
VQRRLALPLMAAMLAIVPATAQARPRPCADWHARTLLSGQGWLENLAFDGRGRLTISALGRNRLLKLRRGGRPHTLLSPVTAPGGQALRRGHFLYFVTGDIAPPMPTGTIDRLNLRTHKRITWATGLTMPNGMTFLPDGDAVVSRDLGVGTGLTRIPRRHPRHPDFNWARIDDTNGLAVDPNGRFLYVARTFSDDGEIDRVNIAHPRRVRAVGHLGAGVSPDDMTIDAKGILYVAGFLSGEVFRLNPRTGRSCAIATGLSSPTSPRFGGAGWRAKRLYVTTAGGDLVELRPPR